MKNLAYCLGIALMLSVTNVSAQGVSQKVKEELVRQMIHNGDITNACVREVGSIAEAIDVQPEFLNNDKLHEYVVSGSGSCCGGARRCNTWIYEYSGNRYRKIFGDKDGEQVDIEVLKTRTNGYRDIQGVGHAGDTLIIGVHKFDGRTYKQSGGLEYVDFR